MGPLLVLVSPCFRKNVSLCSLGNFFRKMYFFLFWKSKFQNGAHLIKWLFLTYFYIFYSKTQKFLQHISRLHTYTYFAHPIDFYAFPILQKLQICRIWFLFGVTPGVDSYSRHFGAINKSIKWWAKFRLECLLLIFIYTYGKFIVIWKPRPDFEWR